MTRIKRRQLLSLTGSLLATLGLSQLELKQRAIFYRSVLAENTPRKRALLVGVNNYPDTRWITLEGAVNDVKLQQELLIHRFGFQSDQILLLTDHEATRENILQAFEEHLIKWAQPGDVVVFHFSGHGSQVFDPDQIFQDGQVSTIVPVDSILPPGYPNKGGKVNDITGHTLWLLMQAINTENVTFILDSCHSGGARKGILTVRSRPGNRELNRTENSNIQLLASPQEQEYQKQLMSRLNLTASDLATERKKGVPKGIMLAAARTDQAAIDASFGDTAAGIFTYILTRYLWQQTGGESVSQVMVSATATTDRILREYFPTAGLLQQPEFNTREGSNNSQQAVYFLKPDQKVPAEAVVTQVQGNQVDLFLGGIDPRTLEAFGRGAILTLVDGEGKERGQVQIESRQELTAKGKLMQTRDNIASGTLLQERSRAIPSDLTLRIRLDASLQQAKQALEAIKRIEVVSLEQTNFHYILGRISPIYHQQLQQLKVKKLPEVGSIALFSPALDLVPDSAGIAGEKVTDAVERLRPKLKSLLAARLVKLTLNNSSSRLSVAVAMETVDGSQLVAESFTVRGATITPVSQTRGLRGLTTNAQKIKLGTLIRFIVQNNESFPLYICVLLVSVDGGLMVLSPSQGNEDLPPLAPQETINIPDVNKGDHYRFKVVGDLGLAEVLVIASTTPLKKAIDLLRTLAADRGESARGTPINSPQLDEAIFSLLDDLDEGSRGSGTTSFTGVRQIDTRQMAAMSITFEVTEM
ncbi:MAG: caspase family protein [Microcystis aeruginosa WS75]|nr:caspase family protein [Microcystis aeruginosa WS75]